MSWEKITLYYRLTISPEDNSDNYSVSNFVTDPVVTAFRGISNLYMTESDCRTYNKTILTFQSLRTPTNTSLPGECKVPSMYNETVNINVPDNNNNYDKNYVQAVANYI
jgi:hypothetical protein